MSLIPSYDKSRIVRGYAQAVNQYESFKLSTSRSPKGAKLVATAGAMGERQVDYSWLNSASAKYQISADIRDYVMVEVPTVEGNVPNRNMNCFLSSRLQEFLPQYGCQCFQTFIGKPAFLEHDHEDETKAKGVIFDATFKIVNGRSFVFILKGFDRTKDAKLAEDVLTRKINGHSMSAYAGFFDCSVCGKRYDTKWQNACRCLVGQPRVPKELNGMGVVQANGVLTYNMPADFYFFEDSAVGDQANWISSQVQQFEGYEG